MDVTARNAFARRRVVLKKRTPKNSAPQSKKHIKVSRISIRLFLDLGPGAIGSARAPPNPAPPPGAPPPPPPWYTGSPGCRSSRAPSACPRAPPPCSDPRTISRGSLQHPSGSQGCPADHGCVANGILNEKFKAEDDEARKKIDARNALENYLCVQHEEHDPGRQVWTSASHMNREDKWYLSLLDVLGKPAEEDTSFLLKEKSLSGDGVQDEDHVMVTPPLNLILDALETHSGIDRSLNVFL
ncbi:hypothetical protein SELMODRAFT_443135 [Selaginella moellendorffii]|uniref:Uncharacterized protein n=1 Tax=Selaginella moellendorffii TaxID=88036 RepID=D8RYX0_SELML|nr:hypothetical protein SELMODRAFT_443135 [Selaginella moellendorffii]